MRMLGALCIAVWAGSGTADALAQQADDPAIVVEGERPQTESAIGDLAREVAGQPRPRRPLARYLQPMCLTVAASDPDFAQAIARRIIDNAKQAKVPTRSGRCKPNALVAFSDDAHAQLQEIRDSGRRLFAGLSRRELDLALSARDPAYVFQASEEAASSGQAFLREPGMPPGNRKWSTGRLNRDTLDAMLSALVVIENKAISGMSVTQLADYASLRLLAPTGEIDAQEAGAPPTIMTLFVSPDGAPAEMTRFDRAYLDALYRLPRSAFSSEVLRAAVLDVKRGQEEGDDQAGSASK